MIEVLSTNILSPLGETTAANLAAVLRGDSAVKLWSGRWGLPYAFQSALFSDEQASRWMLPGQPRFVSLALASIKQALGEVPDIDRRRTRLVLSTTKGNVEALTVSPSHDDAALPPSASADMLDGQLGLDGHPLVVDNACISGLSALIVASRLLQSGECESVIVCGAEVQSAFIVSGFQALKAMSAHRCRPFDIERTGLNLGEAAATIILRRNESTITRWRLEAGAMANDAYHLTSPSPKAEGAYRALESILQGHDAQRLACVSAHGTATLFNDQMESVAIERAGLESVPVVGLKAYFGHTMGACGVLESALMMTALDQGVIPATLGYSERGVSAPIRVTTAPLPTQKKAFIKMLSGFGGSNAAVWFDKDSAADTTQESTALSSDPASENVQAKVACLHQVEITPKSVVVDGHTLACEATGKALLTDLYKRAVGDYPRFYKMDLLSRLGFLTAELLLKADEGNDKTEISECAAVLFGHHGSVVADRNYLRTIATPEDFYPSPERFIYTLPNIVIGEIAIRHQLHAETTFIYLPRYNESELQHLIQVYAERLPSKYLLTGWMDAEDDENYFAKMQLLRRT